MDDIDPRAFANPMIQALIADGWDVRSMGNGYGRFFTFVATKGEQTYEVRVEEVY